MTTFTFGIAVILYALSDLPAHQPLDAEQALATLRLQGAIVTASIKDGEHTQMAISIAPSSRSSLEQLLVLIQHVPSITSLKVVVPFPFERVSAKRVITSESLVGLRRLTQLKHLAISDSQLNDDSLSCIAPLSGLQTLRLNGGRITENGLQHLASLRLLEVLDLEGNKQIRRLDPWLSSLNCINTLILTDTAVTEDGFADLKQCSSLRTLEIGSTFDLTTLGGSKMFTHLANLQNLENLTILNVRVPEGALILHGNRSKLMQVRIVRFGNPLNEHGGPSLDPLVSIVDLQAIGKLPKLQKLAIDSLSINDETLPQIGQPTHLEELNLTASRISDRSLQHIATLSTLRRLVLDGTPITDIGLQYLRRLQGLQEISVAGTQVTPAGLRSLRGAIPALRISTGNIVLGVEFDSYHRAVVRNVRAGSIADVAGLLIGDIIVAINGEVLSDVQHLQTIMATLNQDAEFEMCIRRGDLERVLRIVPRIH